MNASSPSQNPVQDSTLNHNHTPKPGLRILCARNGIHIFAQNPAPTYPEILLAIDQKIAELTRNRPQASEWSDWTVAWKLDLEALHELRQNAQELFEATKNPPTTEPVAPPPVNAEIQVENTRNAPGMDVENKRNTPGTNPENTRNDGGNLPEDSAQGAPAPSSVCVDSSNSPSSAPSTEDPATTGILKTINEYLVQIGKSPIDPDDLDEEYGSDEGADLNDEHSTRESHRLPPKLASKFSSPSPTSTSPGPQPRQRPAPPHENQPNPFQEQLDYLKANWNKIDDNPLECQRIIDEIADSTNKKSPFDHLSADEQAFIFNLLQSHKLDVVRRVIALPPPLGLAFEAANSSYHRFKVRYAKRCQADRKKSAAALANKTLSDPQSSDAELSSAYQHLLNIRLLETVNDPEAKPAVIRDLTQSIARIRSLDLAERKLKSP